MSSDSYSRIRGCFRLDIPPRRLHPAIVNVLASLLSVTLAATISAEAASSEWLHLLDEAPHEEGFEERLLRQQKALDAILKADTATLVRELVAWGRDENASRRNSFIRLAWTRLAKQDHETALKALSEIHHQEAFEEAAREVWAAVADTNPALAYAAAQRFAPKDADQHSACWLVQHIMRALGAAWFRATSVETLKRLPTLSHPDLMATAVFQGCMQEVRSAEDWLALLDRYVGVEKPVIEENHIKNPNLCEQLVEGAAHADLAKTRAWIEKRFPSGTGRMGTRDPHRKIVHARRALFDVWRIREPRLAADWLAAQMPVDDSDAGWDLFQCVEAVAGEDFERLPAALDWLAANRPATDVSAAINKFLSYHFEDPAFHEPFQKLAQWLSKRPLAEREALLFSSAQQNFVRLQTPPAFLATAIPEEAPRQALVKRLQALQSSDEAIEPSSWLLHVFHPPATDEKLIVSAQDEHHCRELARQHEEARTSADPVRRRQGLVALEWMQKAPAAELRPILLARLRDHRMDWFSEDLLAAWVSKDWRDVEAFAMKAPLPARKRNQMLVHLFREAALKQPDAVLQRLRELETARLVNPVALSGSAVVSRASWLTYYDGESIVRSLARGWTRQNDVQAVARIQALPLSWQTSAREVLLHEFTTAEGGEAILNALQPGRDPLEYQLQLCQVLGRLPEISPTAGLRWIKAHPELLKEASDINSAVQSFYRAWQRVDREAADKWYRDATSHSRD